MKIGINARSLQNVPTGVANYLSNLIFNLKEIDKENEYLLFIGSDKPVSKTILDSGFDYDVSKMPTHNQALKILWTHLYLPHVLKKNKINIFHEFSFVAPLLKTCPTIVTVYDLAHLHIPSCYKRRNILYFKSLLSRSIKQADAVIAISENTKKDIVSNFSIPPEKIQVIYLGVNKIFQPIEAPEEIEKVKTKYKIKGDFILSVSGICPRKNYVRLIKAFKVLKEQKKTDAQLVIVGEKAWWYEEVFNEVTASGLGNDVIFCGYASTKELLYLYNSATVFVHPSLYEGFGLPILEAMACTCPVVASNTSSMPEVCGEAALLVDPRSISELSDRIYRLTRDNSLRGDLIEKGLKQVKKFSWSKTAKETLTLYKDIA